MRHLAEAYEVFTVALLQPARQKQSECETEKISLNIFGRKHCPQPIL